MRDYIVFASKDHYNHVGIVRALGEAGIRPIVVVVKSKPQMTSKSKYVKEAYIVDTPEDGIQLIISRFSNNNTEKNVILTGDDVTMMILDKHYNELKDCFIFPNAGEQGRIAHYMSKDVLYELAERNGFQVAKTWKTKVGVIPDGIEYPVMTKAMNSYGDQWKDIVFICRNDEDLNNAFSKMKGQEVLLQRYIEDKVTEAGFEGFAINHGKDLFFSIQALDLYTLPEQYCPYLKMKNCDDTETVRKTQSMLEEIGFEGICEIEFVVDSKGTYWFLEINFRNTIMGWATNVAGMPSAVLWPEAMISGKIEKEKIYKPMREGFTAMAECWDYDARVKSKKMTHSEWMKEYKNTDAKLYKGRNDFRPFFSFMWYKLWNMR